MSIAEEFRRKADQVEAKAESAGERSVRYAYIEIARYWRDLAEEAERSEQK